MDTKTAAPGSHHQSPSLRARPITIEERERDREELRAEEEPVLEEPLEVAELRLLVPSRPPVPREAERQPDEPDDAEPEHPEEHPGADRAGRRLAREHGAASRVQPERHEQRDLRQHPEDVEDALVPFRVVHELLAEGCVDVDRGQGQAVRDGGRIEQEPSDRECREDDRGEGCSQKASPTSGAFGGGSTGISSTGSGARRIGEPNG